MKCLFLLTIIFSIGVEANYYPFGSDNADTVYSKKQHCIEVSKNLPNYNGCFYVKDKILQTQYLKDVDNLDDPIFRDPNDSPVKIECDDYEDCKSKAYTLDEGGFPVDHVCSSEADTQPKFDKSDSWGSLIGWSADWIIWCEKVSGYGKKKVLVEDADKKAAYEAAKAQDDQAKAMASEGSKALQIGLQAKKLMVGYIKLKNLPKSQRKALRGDLKSIIEALDVGSIDLAIDEIKALTEDGTVVTPEAKALILQVFADDGYDIS